MKWFASSLVVAVAFLGTACPGTKPPPPIPVADTTKVPEPDVAVVEPDVIEASAPDTIGGGATKPEADGTAVPEVPVDYLRVTFDAHDAARPAATVELKVTVLEADVDLAKTETAKAVLRIEDAREATADADKVPALTVTVDRIKPVAGEVDTWEGVAVVDAAGARSEVPVRFEVVEKKADGAIVVEGEAAELPLASFGGAGITAKMGPGVTTSAKVRLTIANLAAPK